MQEWWKEEERRIVVDFDGVLAKFDVGDDPTKIGDPIPGFKEFIKELKKLGKVIIYSCRTNPEVVGEEYAKIARADMRAWFEKHGVEIDEISNGTKPIGHAYIDDKAVPCRPLDSSIPASAAYQLALTDTIRLLKKHDSNVRSYENKSAKNESVNTICPVCGDSDPNNFEYFETSGSVLCRKCGYCLAATN